MIAIIDYNVGNLFSLKSSLEAIGAEAIVTSDVEEIKKADKLILPGVGAFGEAIEKLRSLGLDKVIIEEAKKGKPLLGICLGMQMLFNKSYEYGEHQGLGLIKGNVVSMKGRLPSQYKIPHIGWNRLKFIGNNQLFQYISNEDCVYFVHSYFVEDCDESLIATTEYGLDLTAAVAKDNIYGCQFHPEKSGKVGLNILRAFCEIGD